MKTCNSPYPPHSLTIKAVTWSRDSHGLYDYESRNVQKKLLSTNTSCSLARVGTDIKQSEPKCEPELSEDSSLLCQIETESSDFFISALTEPIWLVARTMKTKYGPGFILQEGHIIKLGRVCFKVTMLRTVIDTEDSDNTQDSDEFDIDIPNERESETCRICLSYEADSTNPLISPCKCSGSMKFIHLLCLRHWLNSRKISRMTDNCVTFSWKSIDCEICKSNIPFSLDRMGKESELLRIEKPKSPFLVLEGVGNDKNSNKGVHIVGITGNNLISLGRGHDADVRISDISVSRTHATIKFIDGCFVVEDKNSKFGTLVNVSDKLKISQSNSIVVQIGRTVISFSTKPQSSNFESHDITN